MAYFIFNHLFRGCRNAKKYIKNLSGSVDLLFWNRIESFLPAVGGGFVTTAQ